MIRLHMPGLPHTRTTSEFSHCAFTGKVRRWAKMMKPFGFDCIHYGVGQPDSAGWAECVEVLQPETQEALLGYDPAAPGPEFVGRDANVGHPMYVIFNRELGKALKERFQPGDIVCAPMGHAHIAAFGAAKVLPYVVETGIGYPGNGCISGYRIYESTAWLHRNVMAEGDRWPWNSEWVVPNYFDTEEWPLRPNPNGTGEYVLFMGRLGDLKGLNEIVAMAAARPDLQFVLCGQGDAAPWLTQSNITYRPPVHGIARAELMHGARCLVMPSRFVEPFGGVAVEAMLTGTVALTPDHSAFRDTIPPEHRCHTLGDWLDGIDNAELTGAAQLQAYAQLRYGLYSVGSQYAAIFPKILAMWKLRDEGKGAWYA
jgi:hypothetical protein